MGIKSIGGIQPRYFLPIIPLVALAAARQRETGLQPILAGRRAGGGDVDAVLPRVDVLDAGEEVLLVGGHEDAMRAVATMVAYDGSSLHHYAQRFHAVGRADQQHRLAVDFHRGQAVDLLP